MFPRSNSQKTGALSHGQSISDYIMMLMLISAAILSMRVFVKRAIQAKLRDTLVASGYNNHSRSFPSSPEERNFNGRDRRTLYKRVRIEDNRVIYDGYINGTSDYEAKR